MAKVLRLICVSCLVLIVAGLFVPQWLIPLQPRGTANAVLPNANSGDAASDQVDPPTAASASPSWETMDRTGHTESHPLFGMLGTVVEQHDQALGPVADQLQDDLTRAEAILNEFKRSNRSAIQQANRRVRPPGRTPHLLLVILQGVSSDNLHCYNEQVKPTPGFDQLAERGVRLTQFQLTAAESAADGTGLWENASSPGDRRSWSLVAHLWQEGYSTALIGDCSGLTSDPRERGFDHWYGFRTQADASAQFPTSVLSNGRRLEVVSNTKQPTVSATEILLEEAAAHQSKMSRQRPVATIVSLRLQGLTVSEQDDVASRLLSKLDQRRFGSSTAMIVVGVPESAERRRPFFAVWPGHLPAGSTWTEVTTFADATATLLEIAESPRRQSKPRGVSQLQNWRGLEPAE